MQFELTDLPEFFVAGISVRTINKDGRSEKDIGDLWTRFMSENIAAQISGKLSEETCCVYTDYESDYTGWYTAVLGCKVSEPFTAPGIITTTITAGKYRIYKPTGKFPEYVANTWRQIWQEDIKRSYIADYDLYKAGADSFEQIQTEIYLGVI